ncbi:hypothetical protein AAES_132919 [Amazona aestiva]|uniref:Uncharacterized protein n=1 Tax=Amazona aestiva TaxID=12930 RepID=A0A0Q3M1X0_AMAAE|nr:hypothetical protein AAES_132919 [Amazona aestiva]
MLNSSSWKQSFTKFPKNLDLHTLGQMEAHDSGPHGRKISDLPAAFPLSPTCSKCCLELNDRQMVLQEIVGFFGRLTGLLPLQNTTEKPSVLGAHVDQMCKECMKGLSPSQCGSYLWEPFSELMVQNVSCSVWDQESFLYGMKVVVQEVMESMLAEEPKGLDFESSQRDAIVLLHGLLKAGFTHLLLPTPQLDNRENLSNNGHVKDLTVEMNCNLWHQYDR